MLHGVLGCVVVKPLIVYIPNILNSDHVAGSPHRLQAKAVSRVNFPVLTVLGLDQGSVGYSTPGGSDLVGGQRIWRAKGTRGGFLMRLVVFKGVDSSSEQRAGNGRVMVGKQWTLGLDNNRPEMLIISHG